MEGSALIAHTAVWGGVEVGVVRLCSPRSYVKRSTLLAAVAFEFAIIHLVGIDSAPIPSS